MRETPTLWHYYVPNFEGQGWAEVVLGSNGFFAAITDFGNYAYAWRHTGVADFRQFVVSLSADYALSKLTAREFDGYRTEENLRELILERRRRRKIAQDDARAAYDDLSDLANEAAYAIYVNDHGHVLGEGFYESVVYGPCAQARAFAKYTLPRLQALLEQELAQELSACGG